MINKLLLPAAALALLATGCQTTGSADRSRAAKPADRFAQADANKDGKLSQNEAIDYYVIAVFAALDKNKDGKLSLSECAVEGAPATVKNFKKRDLNKDGYVTLQEAIAYARKHGIVVKEFAKADKNHDGYLTREEVIAFYGSKEGKPN